MIRVPLRIVIDETIRLHGFCERHGFVPVAFTHGSKNEERYPDVLYELR